MTNAVIIKLSKLPVSRVNKLVNVLQLPCDNNQHKIVRTSACFTNDPKSVSPSFCVDIHVCCILSLELDGASAVTPPQPLFVNVAFDWRPALLRLPHPRSKNNLLSPASKFPRNPK